MVALTEQWFGAAAGDVAHGADGTTVTLAGELDLYARDVLRRLLYDPECRRRVTLDLRGVTFVDSTTLGELLQYRRWLGARGGTLAIRCAHADVVRAFAVTGLDRVFDVQQAPAPSA